MECFFIFILIIVLLIIIYSSKEDYENDKGDIPVGYINDINIKSDPVKAGSIPIEYYNIDDKNEFRFTINLETKGRRIKQGRRSQIVGYKDYIIKE